MIIARTKEQAISEINKIQQKINQLEYDIELICKKQDALQDYYFSDANSSGKKIEKVMKKLERLERAINCKIKKLRIDLYNLQKKYDIEYTQIKEIVLEEEREE